MPDRDCPHCGMPMLYHPAEYEDEPSAFECPECVYEEVL